MFISDSVEFKSAVSRILKSAYVKHFRTSLYALYTKEVGILLAGHSDKESAWWLEENDVVLPSLTLGSVPSLEVDPLCEIAGHWEAMVDDAVRLTEGGGMRASRRQLVHLVVRYDPISWKAICEGRGEGYHPLTLALALFYREEDYPDDTLRAIRGLNLEVADIIAPEQFQGGKGFESVSSWFKA